MSNQLKDLLQFSTNLQQTATDESAPRKTLDSDMLRHIMGPDDAQLMLESMQAIEDPSLSQEHKEIAFENFETLVEQIDNANNLENMKLWQPLLQQLSKPEALYRKGGAAVAAAAVQNNPRGQDSFIKLGGLDKMLLLFQEDPDVGVRRKALFAITSAVRNNSAATQLFAARQGWQVFTEYLKEPSDVQIQKRIVFFLGSMFLETESDETAMLDVFVDHKITEKLVTLLVHEQVLTNEDLTEKILNTLMLALSHRIEIVSKGDKATLRSLIPSARQMHGEHMFTTEEWENLVALTK